MNQVTDQQIIEILRKEAVPALGCTEPVACALACAKCKEVLGDVPEHLDVLVSGNIYKNGMGVDIPGTGMVGLPIAAALGAVCGKSEYGLEVLKEVNVGDNLQRAKDMLGQVTVSLKEDAPDKLYAEALATKGNDTVKVIIVHTHTNIVLVEKNGKEIEEYVNEITLASREDFLQLSVNPGEVYLSHVIDAIRGLYEEKLHNLHTGFQIASYTDLLLKGDANRLIEVLQNLLKNAIKYGDGKCISIDFSEEEDCRLITVRNSGCSLKQEELINLFDSFYRGSNVGSTDGSGLGLYISRQLMQKMDGEVFAEIKEDDFCATVVVRKA